MIGDIITLDEREIRITSDWSNNKVGSDMIQIIRQKGDSKNLKKQILENQILRKSFEESISINRAVVERLKREKKVFWMMEAAVIVDENLLKHMNDEAKKLGSMKQ